eukprot:SM000268S09737  [mRNA]  locus=s268:77935:83347:+ [translate_table: standard]
MAAMAAPVAALAAVSSLSSAHNRRRCGRPPTAVPVAARLLEPLLGGAAANGTAAAGLALVGVGLSVGLGLGAVSAAAIAAVAGGGGSLEGLAAAAKDAWDVGNKDVTRLAHVQTPFNDIQVIEYRRAAHHSLAGATPHAWTASYYDLFATLPPLLPGSWVAALLVGGTDTETSAFAEGPIAILGLGAGTGARVIQNEWPEVDMHAWELDPEVVAVARRHFDLGDLEHPEQRACYSGFMKDAAAAEQSAGSSCPAEDGKKLGRLVVHVGDALADDAATEGGFAGIIVDLYAKGVVIPPLQEASTWRAIKAKLRPGGRVLANIGGACVLPENGDSAGGQAIMTKTLAAMSEVFPGQLWRNDLEENGEASNTMALTGPDIDFRSWRAAVPPIAEDTLQYWERVPVTHLRPLHTKTTTLAAKFRTIQGSDRVLCIPIILHVDKCKACNKKNFQGCQDDVTKRLDGWEKVDTGGCLRTERASDDRRMRAMTDGKIDGRKKHRHRQRADEAMTGGEGMTLSWKL